MNIKYFIFIFSLYISNVSGALQASNSFKDEDFNDIQKKTIKISVQDLPPEIRSNIYSYLDLDSVKKLTLVSKFFEGDFYQKNLTENQKDLANKVGMTFRKFWIENYENPVVLAIQNNSGFDYTFNIIFSFKNDNDLCGYNYSNKIDVLIPNSRIHLLRKNIALDTPMSSSTLESFYRVRMTHGVYPYTARVSRIYDDVFPSEKSKEAISNHIDADKEEKDFLQKNNIIIPIRERKLYSKIIFDFKPITSYYLNSIEGRPLTSEEKEEQKIRYPSSNVDDLLACDEEIDRQTTIFDYLPPVES